MPHFTTRWTSIHVARSISPITGMGCKSIYNVCCITIFHGEKYDFNSPRLIEDLAQDFKVTEELCIKRMEQIKRKIISYSSLWKKDIKCIIKKTLLYQGFSSLAKGIHDKCYAKIRSQGAFSGSCRAYPYG